MRAEERYKKIFKTGIIGIAVNALIAAVKLVVGSIAGSIAIILDGVNNLSDAGSSLITIVGTALSAKPADRKHPLGYGRMEYLSSLLISAIILYAGATSLVEAVKKIFSDEMPEYDTLTLVMVAIAVVLKLWLALYTQKAGKKAQSDSLIASGKEAILDVFVSLSTLVAAILFILWHFNIEAYLGAAISLLIIKAGVELFRDTVSKILGEPTDLSIVKEIKQTINSFEPVKGAYDLIMNNYGPNAYVASVHIEVDENLTAAEIDKLTREIADKVLEKNGVFLAAIGIYSQNEHDPFVVETCKNIAGIVLAKEYVRAIHGFYMDKEKKHIRFDLVISLNTKKRREVYNDALAAVKEAYPDYEILAGFDTDVNEA